jgi:hypothetical protein
MMHSVSVRDGGKSMYYDKETMAKIKDRIRVTGSNAIGGHGFRKGMWHFTVDGAERSFYCSVPHACELPEQDRIAAGQLAAQIYREEGHPMTADPTAAC